jgi:hypothetical protein
MKPPVGAGGGAHRPVVEGLRFPPSRNASSHDWDSSGYVRERVGLETLVRNNWLDAERAEGELRIKLGERAKKRREGN